MSSVFAVPISFVWIMEGSGGVPGMISGWKVFRVRSRWVADWIDVFSEILTALFFRLGGV
jgi:hypothetical protein